MQIEGKTVVFKTGSEFFEMEKRGKKPYTVRILKYHEFSALIEAGIERVRIVHVLEERVFFERDVISVVELVNAFGRIVAGIAWDPRSV